MIGKIVFGVVGLAALSASAIAAAQAKRELPQSYTVVLSCTEIANSSARLACFDRAVAELSRSEAEQKVVILSAEEVRRTKRGLFGLTLGDLPFIGSNADDGEEIKEISANIANVSGRNGARLVVSLDDGSVWEQSEARWMPQPKAGDTIVIKKAALGSYFARIEGRTGFRIKRRN